MLTPEYLARAPTRLVSLYSQVEEDILANMAERIARYDYYIPAVQHQHQRLRAMGALESEIEMQLSALTGRSLDELQRLMTQAVDDSLEADAKVYAAAGMGQIDPLEAEGVKRALRSGLLQTGGLFENLTRTTAHTATKQFEDALDRAWLQIISGGFDYNTAIRNTIKDLARKGVESITYPTGHRDTLEVAVRRAVVTGCNQTAAKAQIELMDELGVELVEVSAHAGARPSHAKWQGKVFSRYGRTGKYEDFVEATGYGTGAGLCGWNCSHSFGPYVEGAPRAYSPALLEQYSAETVKYNGKNMTEYEALQQQRYIERGIRRWKREEAAMAAAGLSTDEAAAKVREWQSRQRDFIRQTGLKRDYSREQIAVSSVSPKQLPNTKTMSGFSIGRSIGAKSKNYEIVDKETGLIYHFVEGTKIQDAEVFAGAGVRSKLRQEVAEGLSREFGGRPSDWQHAKGIGELTEGDEEIRTAEVHWFQAKGVGKVRFKVKRWLDE